MAAPRGRGLAFERYGFQRLDGGTSNIFACQLFAVCLEHSICEINNTVTGLAELKEHMHYHLKNFREYAALRQRIAEAQSELARDNGRRSPA